MILSRPKKHKHFNTKQNIAPSLHFYENTTHFNYRISTDTKSPKSPSPEVTENILAIIDAFCNCFITNCSLENHLKYAIHTLFHP